MYLSLSKDSTFFIEIHFFKMKIFFGGNGEEETPVPIPNTEVKLLCADGTALSRGGRVGRCRDYYYTF
jgi:hypothetical protein